MNLKDVEVQVFVHNMETDLESEISFDITMDFAFYESEYEEVVRIAWEIIEEEYVGVDMDDLEIEVRIIRY